MKWTDITSYSRTDTERNPRVLECRLTPHISFKVHKYIYYGDAWLITAPCVGLDKYNLDTEDLETAKKKATSIMSQKLTERKNEISEALALLGCPAKAEWHHNGEFAMCSNCYDLFKEREVTVFNYCPTCGTKMDLED